MKLKILFFGVARDISEEPELEIEMSSKPTIKNLREKLIKEFPDLQKLNSLALAVNQKYADDEEMVLNSEDEIALIPPVSGG